MCEKLTSAKRRSGAFVASCSTVWSWHGWVWRTVRETERTSLPISGNDMTTPYQESEEAHKQWLARVRARRRQLLASETAKKTTNTPAGDAPRSITSSRRSTETPEVSQQQRLETRWEWGSTAWTSGHQKQQLATERLGNPCHRTVHACAYRSLSRSPTMHGTD